MIVKDYTLRLKTRGVCHAVDITQKVAEQIAGSGVQSGTITVFVVGSTAAVTTVEYEPGLVKDLEELFEELAPQTREYHHEQTWHDGNGFSHVRASLLKPSLVIPIVKGKMRLGAWQQIVLLDFDNRPRDREVALQLMGV